MKTPRVGNDIKPILFTQVIAAILSAWTHLGMGTTLGYSAPTLPQLTDANSTDLFLSQDEAALFSSLINLGAVLGSVSAGPIMVCVGQRIVMLVTMPLTLAAWLGVAWASSATLLCVARFVLGLCSGLLGSSATMFVLELTHCSVRGTLSAMIDVARGLGVLFVYGLGATSLSWRYLALICGVISTVPPFVGLLWIPDSPRWLMSHGKLHKAETSLTFYRGKQFDINHELNDIQSEIEKRRKKKTSVWNQLNELRHASVRQRLFFLCFIALAQQFCGNLALLAYAVTIFQLAGTGLNPYMCSIMVAAIRICGSVTYLATIDKIGRRILFLISLLICSTACCAIGVFFYLKETQGSSSLVENLFWLPLTAMLAFTFCICINTPIVCILGGEIFPTSFRQLGMSFLDVFFFGGAFTVSQCFPFMTESMKPYGTFWFYSAVALTIAWLPLAFLPETKGRTLEEIEVWYRSKHEQKSRNVEVIEEEAVPLS